MSKITSKVLQKAFYVANQQRFEMVAPNIYLDWQFNEMDIFALRKSGYVDEIEVKVSKSDFLADFKKTVKVEGALIETSWGRPYNIMEDKLKHKALVEGLCHCNRFSFLIPEDLVEKCEIPDYAGIYVYKSTKFGGRVHEVKAARLLHRRKLSEAFKYSVGRKMAYRYWQLQK